MPYPAWALVVGSILTTVALVAVNKIVFAGGFPFVLTLSCLHFIATFSVMVLLSKGLGAFEPKFLPLSTNFIVAGMGVASIGFMNYSLKYNSVGTYQMAKLTIIPVVLLYNALRGEFASRKIHITLSIVLLGVGIATVTDVQVTSLGLMFAAAAVVSTAQYQIWQGSKQKEANLSEMQLTMSVSGMQMLIAGACAMFFEGEDVAKLLRGDGNKRLTTELSGQILLSCLLAVSANVHSYALIGRTSAVTFQVVGHGKTCLIILAGYIMYPLPSMEEFMYNFFGVTLAVFAVILYSNLKMNENKSPDWCDLYAPKPCHSILGVNPKQTEGAPKPAGDYARVPTNDPEAAPSKA